jgi:hypothetical protein
MRRMAVGFIAVKSALQRVPGRAQAIEVKRFASARGRRHLPAALPLFERAEAPHHLDARPHDRDRARTPAARPLRAGPPAPAGGLLAAMVARSRTPKRARAAPRSGLTFDDARALGLALGMEEGTSYGTPALKARGKLAARLKEDGETLVVRIEPDARDLLLAADPETFFITDHYAPHPWVLVRLPRVDRAALGLLLEEAQRLVAPARKPRPKATPGSR